MGKSSIDARFTIRARHTLRKTGRSIAAAFFCLSVVDGASGQGFSFGGTDSSQLRGVIVTEAETMALTADAFQRRAARLLRHAGESDRGRREVLQSHAATHTESYLSAARDALITLSGDGVLHAQEVASELEPLYARRIEDLSAALEAERSGYPPPPFRWRHGSDASFSRALLEYTVFVRNSPTAFAKWLAMVLAGIASAWCIRRVLEWAHQRFRAAGWARILLDAVRGPLYLTAAALGLLLGLTWVWMPGLAKGSVEEAVRVSLVVVGFWLLWNLCDFVGGGVASATEHVVGQNLGSHRRLIIRRTLRIVVGAAFVLVLVHAILDSNLTGVLAGLGVVGLALSFALRGSIENIAASFTIFGDEPFSVGDVVIYSDTWGTVEDIGFRSTRIRTLENHLITVPNQELVDGAVYNVGARGAIRRRFRLGLEFDTPPEKVREAIDIVSDVIGDNEHTPKDKAPHVVFESMGEYELRLLVEYHYEPPEYWQALAFDSEVNLSILERLAEAGIELAYPTMTSNLRVDELPDLTLLRDSEKEARDDAQTADSNEKPPV